MIIRTFRQCIKACPINRVYVATDDQRIKDVCEKYHANTLMTSTNCLTGTDRVAECMIQLDSDIFINVQGDEPIFNPKDIQILIKASEKYPGEIINGYCRITNEELFRNPSIPKVVMRQDGRLLYMSRATIPTTKNNSFKQSWRQVCAYVFPRDALKAFASQEKKTPLENIEDIEILRFLEIGWDVRMIELSNTSIAVDNPEDIIRVNNAIRERGI